ncbi:MAG: NAD-glutamate dehydrogenase, partial [Gemmatimonadota bacterium]|nr:NAD-glutamate dehydrogenase [Gemmatimonadota bacterium]
MLRAHLADRPFIVDTVREYLAARGLTIHHFVHPVLSIRRGPAGEVLAVGEGELEALLHCEVERVADPGAREEIRAEVERRLTDVVAATADFDAMLAAVDETILAVEGYADAHPERTEEYGEVVAFLRWLRDGNFVFLGYRGYDILPHDGERAVQVEAGSGLGILRDDRPSRWATPV